MLISIANAQIGGPKDINRAVTDKKVGNSSSAAPKSVSQQFEKEGVRVNFSVQSTPTESSQTPGLVVGTDAVVSFRVTDARTGPPVSGLRPAAWISSRKAEHAPNEAECKDKIRTFMGGLLSARAEIDLNKYLLLTLNHDNTISVINPQVAFSRTKLENLITLPGNGADWVLLKNKEILYVTLPDQSSIAVINTITRKIIDTISTGEKTKPRRIALQPDGRYAWVGLDDSPLVAVIDTATNKLAATLPVGAGLHNLAFTSDSRFVYITNSAADTVSAIDTKRLTKVAEIPVGKTPVPVAYSRASSFIYVAAINGGSISVIDPAGQRVITSIPMKRGVVALRFDPEGRYGFAVNQVESTVEVIDAATNKVLGGGAVTKGPDQVTFTDRYAYIRGTGSEKFSMIELSAIAKGKFTPVDIQAGRLPASSVPEEIGVADMIQPTPEGNAVMVSNTPDGMIYYYVEGMMAPMGTIQNYKRRPHGLLLLDRSLSEVAPGVYQSPVKLNAAGRFDVPMLINQPRLINCFQLEVGDSPNGEKVQSGRSIAVEALFKAQQFKPGETVKLRFKLTDPTTKQPVTNLEDVRILAFEPPGVWQQRQWAKEVEEGVYEVTQVFPRVGLYNVMVSVVSRGVNFTDVPHTAVRVLNPTERSEARKGN